MHFKSRRINKDTFEKNTWLTITLMVDHYLNNFYLQQNTLESRNSNISIETTVVFDAPVSYSFKF